MTTRSPQTSFPIGSPSSGRIVGPVEDGTGPSRPVTATSTVGQPIGWDTDPSPNRGGRCGSDDRTGPSSSLQRRVGSASATRATPLLAIGPPGHSAPESVPEARRSHGEASCRTSSASIPMETPIRASAHNKRVRHTTRGSDPIYPQGSGRIRRGTEPLPPGPPRSQLSGGRPGRPGLFPREPAPPRPPRMSSCRPAS